MPNTSVARAVRRGPASAALLGALVASACTDGSTSPGSTAFRNNPCTAAISVQLQVAQATRIDCTNGGTTVTLAGGGASYLIVPEFATSQAALQLVRYSIASGDIAAASAAARAMTRPAFSSAASSAGALPAPRNLRAQMAADRMLRAKAFDVARTGRFQATAQRARAAARFAAAPPPPAGSIRQFQVLSTFNTPSTWAAVNASLAYVGSNILLYVDTLAPANGFTPTQLTNFGQFFDQVLFPIDTTAFGAPSDVDANARFIVLMSPVVNHDTPAANCSTQGYVAGFFDTEDFLPASDPHSNQGEIFYTIVPDPTGASSCAHSVAQLESVVPGVFLHELQHLVSFSQHVIVSGGNPASGWADEGLSIVAEELGSLHYEQMCPPPSCRTNPAQLFPDSSQGYIADLLFDSYEYALLPDTASVTLHSDADLGSAWRGGTWLLMRYLGDQKGNAFFRAMEHGPSEGVADIEFASGASFPSLFADFGLALYTDSLPGLPRTTAPPANRFAARNVKAMWARLFTTSGPSVLIPTATPIKLFSITSDTSSSVMDPGTTTFFRLDTPAGAATTSLQFSAPGGTAFPASLKAQLAIFRLPPGQ